MRNKLVNLHSFGAALQEMLVAREDFWIKQLKTLASFGLNQELSNKKELLSFRVTSAKSKWLSLDIINDIIVKQNIFDVIYFYLKSRISKRDWKTS